MRGKTLILALFGLFTSIAAASAQIPNDLRNVLGGMLQSAITRATQAQWNRVSPAEVACIDQALRRQGNSVQAIVQHGVMPSDGRLSSLRSACRSQNPQQPVVLAQTSGPKTPYAVDGLALGARVQFGSATYRDYECGPSEQFAGFTWCHRSHHDREARGQYTSYYSILHSADGTVVYVNRSLDPAFFAPNEANDEIQKISRKYGVQPRLIQMPNRPGFPDGIIAAWGDVVLEPVDETTIRQLAAGESVNNGFMIDFISNYAPSARAGLPIYHLSGGAGFVWAASFDRNGRGTLRFLAINASAFSQPTQAQGVPRTGNSQANVDQQEQLEIERQKAEKKALEQEKKRGEAKALEQSQLLQEARDHGFSSIEDYQQFQEDQKKLGKSGIRLNPR